MADEETTWLTLRQVSTLWPGVASVHETARANGVRYRADCPASAARYHAGDVRRVAPVVTAAPPEPARRTGLAGCLVLLGLFVVLVALALWAWREGLGGHPPGYWY